MFFSSNMYIYHCNLYDYPPEMLLGLHFKSVLIDSMHSSHFVLNKLCVLRYMWH